MAGTARRRAPGAPLDKIITALERCGFSPQAYVRANRDLLLRLPDADTATIHLIAYGITEGRRFPIDLDPEGFDALGALGLAPAFKAATAAALVNNALAPASAFWSRSAGEQRALWKRLIPMLQGMATPYLIVGDSHSSLYRHLITEGTRPLLPVHVLLSACSALGLGNPQSRSGGAHRLAPLAQAIPPDVPTVFKFGQVDVEFVFAFKRIEAGERQFDPQQFDQFCGRSVESYIGFLDDHFGHAAVTVASIFPPTLSDAAWREGYVNAHVAATEGDRPLEEIRAGVRQLAVPDLRERTRHHAHYNGILRDRVARSGFAFLDDFSPFVGAAGVVDPRFIPTTGGRDHHLERQPTTPIIRDIIAARVLP
jgi:hypothetical protein